MPEQMHALVRRLTALTIALNVNGKILKYNGTTWVIADESLADTDALI